MSSKPSQLARLCAEKRLDPAWLRDDLGVMERDDGALVIPYRDKAGKTIYTRLRNPPDRKPRFLSPRGVASIPYGRWRERSETGVLFLCEGESDCWAVWSAGLPALGVAGADLVDSLNHEDLLGVGELYICIDAKGGEVFEARVLQRLAALQFPGRAYAIDMPSGVADVSDLFAQDPAAFREQWEACVRDARRVQVPRSSPPPRAGLRGATGVPATPPERRWTFAPRTFTEMKATVRPPEWLVERLLVRGQPAVIGGPSKALKTSIAMDLCVSLAFGRPFLDRLAVPKPARVVVLSGESGEWALLSLIERIATSKGEDPGTLDDWLTVQTDLPHLSNPLDLVELSRGLKDAGAEVCVIDPLYLSLMAGLGASPDAANMYSMGPLLMGVAESMLGVGVTPILLHHATKPAARTNEPLQLTDLAYSGIGEFARQWLLVNRREAFDPGASNKLWLSAGGSCGQSGLWAVDVDEGQLDESFEGKRWRVDVVPASTARQAERDHMVDQIQRRKQETLEKRVDALLAAIDDLAIRSPESDGWVGLIRARDLAKLDGNSVGPVMEELLRRGLIERDTEHRIAGADGRKRPGVAVRRLLEEADEDPF